MRPLTDVRGQRKRALFRWRVLAGAAAAACFLCVQLYAVPRWHDGRWAASNPVRDGAAFADAVGQCTSFACLHAAHRLPHVGRFNFPHFFIIGYPKCATTSLHAYLEQHPQALGSQPKETQFFTHNGKCWHADTPLTPWGCGAEETAGYLRTALQRDAAVASGLTRAAFESTTDYSWGDPMGPAVIATGIRRELPWLKIILSLREPISHEISGRVHTLEFIKKRDERYRPQPGDDCLSQLDEGSASMYVCVVDRVRDKEGYLKAMAVWLATWPTEQFMIVQFENLTSEASQGSVLGDVARFLGLDPALGPPRLPYVNAHKAALGARQRGWPMQREEYLDLLAYARPLSERIAALLQRYGFYQPDEWLAAWRAAWQANLDSCDASGLCHVVLT